MNMDKRRLMPISANFRLDLDNPLIVVDCRPRKELKYTDINTKIAVYEDRMQCWVLDFGAFLCHRQELVHNNKKFSTNEAGFVILMIAASYLEGNQQYRDGKCSKGNSKKCFIKALNRIFSLDEHSGEIIEEAYDQFRCGLFHSGMTKEKVGLSGAFAKPIEFMDGAIFINPQLFFNTVLKDFNEYILDLKDERNTDLRDKFEQRWNLAR